MHIYQRLDLVSLDSDKILISDEDKCLIDPANINLFILKQRG